MTFESLKTRSTAIEQAMKPMNTATATLTARSIGSTCSARYFELIIVDNVINASITSPRSLTLWVKNASET
ncbi:MAG: hypothetical protein MJ025_01270 [Victivallaceae bacterium]|nr:hypothetical protein [Victivallaceae bacterium]